MSVTWFPVQLSDELGSILMLLLAGWCTLLASRHIKEKPDDVFRNYLFLFTLAIVFFAVSRSFGHLVKQLLLRFDYPQVWEQISPFSGAVNSTIFVVIFAFGIYFQRFQTVHAEIEYYKHNLEEMIEQRTAELERAKNTLENILNNSNPLSITALDFHLLRANDAYFDLWPLDGAELGELKCYESRPGNYCHSDECPLEQIKAGKEFISHEVSKTVHGEQREFIAVSRPYRDVEGKLVGMVESFQDITRLKQVEREMRESEERFRLIFTTNPDAVILSRLADGVILDVNPAFETATGIPRQEAIGQTTVQLELWEEQTAREELRMLLRQHGEVDNHEVNFRPRQGGVNVGLISARLLKLGTEPCVLAVVRDITTEKAAERALIETDRVKSEFISMAAHELNTPLTAMLGYSELLRNPEEFGGFSEEQKAEFLDEIHERGLALSRLVDDLLDISRIERGEALSLKLQETDLVEVLRKKVQRFLAQESPHTFHLDLPAAPQRPRLQLDRHRINQLLDNLLTNAVKYSPAGTEIVLRGRETGQGWELRVIDQGVGMSPEQVERIFEKFYRVDNTNTAIGGLGLGMSIVKQIVEAHQGTIRVESRVGEGTTVVVTLPFAPSQEAASDPA